MTICERIHVILADMDLLKSSGQRTHSYPRQESQTHMVAQEQDSLRDVWQFVEISTKAFVHTPKKKLDPRNFEGVLVGYI